MRALVLALPLSLALAAPAFAQAAPAAPAAAAGPEDVAKVKQVFVYGEDPCPASEGDEIVVCARMPDNDRYRIPKELRTDPNSPAVQSWANRARSIEYVGASGTDSCSPTGSAGFTGCFTQIARAAREERQKMLGSGTWADAVAKAREERLGNLDAESAQIEAQAKADEEAARLKAQREAQQQGPTVTP
ncbi:MULTISPECIES: hypothetical protein [Sphingobium]|uniref:hypothetical protein n=1 Tax=Sphingobium TaxID=165695 RepID=UPI0015EC23FA|nr:MULTISPECIES: hypothetical protein [Sphingobium]MCW2362643.1 hypothetical protein [Sphingobium sp. B10D3B]MCW2395373.1 hypothetical protein [Sphingobium sp. B8D3B]MCW2400677.1 hypothetical protein [Sphingobium sp. B10D7B]MCW2407656.1 hypothetical protein [Sphingobium xanthum]MCW2418888.1 hypothetical protein [Sphingobium sp. B8D3C]